MKFIKTTTLAFLSLTHLAPAQQFPSKLVRIIVPFPAAGAVDATTRIPGERLPARWGQPVIVNSGAAGNIGAAAAHRAEPDGTTLRSCPTPALSINQSLYKDLPCHPAKFVPITITATLPNAIAARIDLPADSVPELVAYAKAKPGTPEAIAQRINAAAVGALKTPEVDKRFIDQGLTPVGNGPARMAASWPGRRRAGRT